MATGLILAILNPDWHQQVLTWMDENLHRHWIFNFHRMGFVLRKDLRAGRAARRRYVEETIKQSQESILKGYNFSLSIYLWNSPTFQNSLQPLLVTPPCTLMTRCLGLGISQIYNPQDIYNSAPDQLRATAGGSGGGEGALKNPRQKAVQSADEGSRWRRVSPRFWCWANIKRLSWCAANGSWNISSRKHRVKWNEWVKGVGVLGSWSENSSP